MDLQTFVEQASLFAVLQRQLGRTPLHHALQGENVLDYEDADRLADYLVELSEELDDELETVELSETVRRAPRGGG